MDLTRYPLSCLIIMASTFPHSSHLLTEYEVGLFSRIWGKAQILRGRPQAALVALEYAIEMGVEAETVQPLIDHAKELSALPCYAETLRDPDDYDLLDGRRLYVRSC